MSYPCLQLLEKNAQQCFCPWVGESSGEKLPVAAGGFHPASSILGILSCDHKPCMHVRAPLVWHMVQSTANQYVRAESLLTCCWPATWGSPCPSQRNDGATGQLPGFPHESGSPATTHGMERVRAWSFFTLNPSESERAKWGRNPPVTPHLADWTALRSKTTLEKRLRMRSKDRGVHHEPFRIIWVDRRQRMGAVHVTLVCRCRPHPFLPTIFHKCPPISLPRPLFLGLPCDHKSMFHTKCLYSRLPAAGPK